MHYKGIYTRILYIIQYIAGNSGLKSHICMFNFSLQNIVLIIKYVLKSSNR